MKILHNARIHIMDDTRKRCDALVFENNTLVDFGDFSGLSEKYPGAKRIDGKGMTVFPGFIDPHIHFLHGAVLKASLDCSPESIPDPETLLSRLKTMANHSQQGEWIVGQGYDPVKYPGGRVPSRHDLDDACPLNPVVIVHYSCHECVTNSIALEQLGISATTPQPFGGEIERDSRGLTGRLVEAAFGPAMSMVVKEVHRQLGNHVMQRLSEAEKLLFSHGITRIGDPAVTSGEAALYKKAMDAGVLKVHVTVYPCSDSNFCGLPFDRVVHEKPANSRSPVCGPMKFFLDGADRAALRLTFSEVFQTAFKTLKRTVAERSLDPFRNLLRSPARLGKDFKLHFGVMMTMTDELESCASQAAVNGYSLAFHALGNEAVEQALAVMERITYTHPVPARLEHAVFLKDKDIRSIAGKNMAVVTQPFFLSHMGPDNIPPISGLKQLPLRSLMDAGVLVAGSSDWPVVSLNPLEAIERAVTRETTGGAVLQPQEAVTVDEAMSMYTRNAAAVLGQESEVGSLEPGKRADFVLLSGDPFQCDARSIHRIRVAETYLGGNRVF